MRRVILALWAACATPGLAAELPQDVAEFAARRERCGHFRGEESDDPARAREILRGQEANCRGTDAALARLKQRHAHDATLRALLDRYEFPVE